MAFLVTVGDWEANKKLDSFRVATEDLGLEEARSRHTICQRTDKDCKDCTLTITTLIGREDASINKSIAIGSSDRVR